MPSLVTERIESVKAGIVSAVAFAIAEAIIISLGTIIVDFFPQASLSLITLGWELLIKIIIGIVSGFLFGVTYRYIIRDDRNSHLNDGAVLAFGLVRGLALIENKLNLSNVTLFEFIFGLFLIAQSVICFAIARLVLDLAISYKLIKPFT